MKAYIKMEKNIKLGDIEIQKQNIYLAKIDANKIVVFNRMYFSKMVLNIFLATKMLKKLNSYVYFSKNTSAYRKNFDKTKYSFFNKK